jgi:hypothetical protein
MPKKITPILIGTINGQPVTAIATEKIGEYTDVLYNEGTPKTVDKDIENARSLAEYYKFSNGHGVDTLDHDLISKIQTLNI